MTSALTLAIPSKGRLMEQALTYLQHGGYGVERYGSERGYRGRLTGIEGIDIAFLSASEIARNMAEGKIDLGITGQDLLCELQVPQSTTIIRRLDFGGADVVVAVPQCWLDVASMADLDEVSENFYNLHGRRLRVATKYPQLTRRFFAEKGVTGYRIVESLGATEATPMSGLAEIIVDITSTGSTLKANFLKVLDDGLILASSAVLAGSSQGASDPRVTRLLCNLPD